MANDFLFTLSMVRSWQHSEACVGGRKDSCICGLTALTARLERQSSNPRAVFLIDVSRTAYPAPDPVHQEQATDG